MTKGILLQSQIQNGETSPIHPDRFSLRWVIEYSKTERVVSEWTPVTKPSITKAFESRKDGEYLIIQGSDQWSNCLIDLAKVDFKLVKGFGYIAEQSAFTDSVVKNPEFIIGMWIELKDNKKIKIYVNGLVKETAK